MTEPERGASAPEQDGPVYSKDYWDNVFEQVGRRPFVKLALAVLVLLYASAIYAPLIANDRPYVIEGVDYSAYQDARRMLAPVTASLATKLGQTPEEFEAGLAEDAEVRDWGESVRLEERALEQRIEVMTTYLPPDEQGRLLTLQRRVEDAARAAIEEGRRETGHRDAEEAAALAREIASALRPRRKDQEEGVALRSTTSYPIAESTTGTEVFFMWLWALLLAWPLWNRLVNRRLLDGDRGRIRRWRRRKAALMLGSSLVVALIWSATVGGSMTFSTAQYKQKITEGELVVERAVFPPLAMGFAESHTPERYRPPTWHPSAELDEEGRYVSGSRRPEPDPVTGFLPPAKVIEVRYAEPDVNSPVRFLLGSDDIGRDLLVRILYGGRISLMVGILSTVLLVLIGVVMGALAGYLGGWVDNLVSRLIEIFQSIPAFFFILTAVAMIPDDAVVMGWEVPPIFTIVVVIALVRWTGVARLVRAEFLRLKEQEFVLAARALGFTNGRVIFRHVLPNGMGPVLVAASFSVAAGILTESAVSFLGFGVKHPIPSWGSLLSEARGQVESWWLQIFPGLLIFLTVFCYNVVGEGVRDALDPRRKV